MFYTFYSAPLNTTVFVFAVSNCHVTNFSILDINLEYKLGNFFNALPSGTFIEMCQLIRLFPSHHPLCQKKTDKFSEDWLWINRLVLFLWFSFKNFVVTPVILIKACKNAFLAIININYLGTEDEFVTIFHIWADIKLVTLILGAHLGAFADCRDCCCCSVEDVCELSIITICKFFVFNLISFIGQACEHVQGMLLFFSLFLSQSTYTREDIQQ